MRKFRNGSPNGEFHVDEIERGRIVPRHQLREIGACSRYYGMRAVDRAIPDGIVLTAGSGEWMADILATRTCRSGIHPVPQCLTRLE